MIRNVFKYLLLIVTIISCSTATVYATDNDWWPRRKTHKKYTSPEECGRVYSMKLIGRLVLILITLFGVFFWVLVKIRTQ